MKKIIALILVVVSLFSTMSIAAYAEDTNENTVTITVNETEFVFDANTTEEFRNKAIAHYFNHNDDSTSTYGLTCTLFGHKLESSIISAVTHKVNATDPRCLRERYNTEVCSRCDYTNSTLISSTYITCC
ncbi:MAG: hypothetical protein IJE74_00890 [Clostridia bacterium]|nr:hypothetical protein [Clostridia bacterium]